MKRTTKRVYIRFLRSMRDAKKTAVFRGFVFPFRRPSLAFFAAWLRVVALLAGSRLDVLSLAMCIYAPAAWRDHCLFVRDARLSSVSR